MKISNDVRLSNPAHAQLLPPSWYTLYQLTKLDDDQFNAPMAEPYHRHHQFAPDSRDGLVESLGVIPGKAWLCSDLNVLLGFVVGFIFARTA